MTIYSKGQGFLYPQHVGNFPQEKSVRYFRLSQEKTHRVFAHWLRDPNEALSSYQTRNKEKDMWGGAVLFPHYLNGELEGIVSFSGLSELADEAVSLALGIHVLNFPCDYKDLARRVVEASNNQVYREMSQILEKNTFS